MFLRRLVRTISASWFMGSLFIILAFAMALATFIENDYGTYAAKALVYNSWWFELIFFLLALNMIGNVFSFRMYQKAKIPVLLFHISFLIIIIGAAITRYSGFEGLLHVREGEEQNIMFSSDSYVTAEYHTKDQIISYNKKVFLSVLSPGRVKTTLKTEEDKIRIRSVGFAPEGVIFDINCDSINHSMLVYGQQGKPGDPFSLELPNGELILSYGSMPVELPFTITLNRFILERYPGSQSPSGYVSEILLNDKEKDREFTYSIFMNNILNYRGYRFFQSSYDNDEKGTILSVNHDWLGTIISYFGYFLLTLGMLWSLFAPNTRFRTLYKKVNEINSKRKKILATIIILTVAAPLFSQIQSESPPIPDKKVAAAFGALWVQDNGGRIKPLNSLHHEIMAKLVKKQTLKGINADQLVLGMFLNPAEWQNYPLITIKDPQIRALLGITQNKAAFSDFFDDKRQYLLQQNVNAVYRINPGERNKFSQELIKIDEQLNIFYMIQMGNLHRVFPSIAESNNKWISPTSELHLLSYEDSLFVATSMPQFFDELRNNNQQEAIEILNSISDYQTKYASEILPTERIKRLELLYNRLNIFFKLMPLYFSLGILLLIVQFITLLSSSLKLKWLKRIAVLLLFVGFLYHSFGLGLRWIIAGHAPWSNGYESMIFVGWAILFAAFLMSGKSKAVLPVTGLFAGIVMMVAHMSSMNPQITNLVPVLQSNWLTMHVSVIISGYGFLSLGALLGFLNLLIMSIRKKSNVLRLQLTIDELTAINEIALTIGLYLLTIGSFIGAVWANESWGRYWGWDPKETWALITIILYAFVLHIRFIPGLKGALAFNTASLITFGSVIMTYLGVNYYLAGMHSYAGGDPVPVPSFIYYALLVVIAVIIAARWNNYNFKKMN